MSSLEYSSRPRFGRSWIGVTGRLIGVALVGVIGLSAFQLVQTLNEDTSSPRSEEERIVQDALAAVEQDPNNAEARWRLSIAYSTVKDYQRAFDEAEQSVRLNRKAPEPFYALGLAYKGLGDDERAIKAYQKAASIPGSYGDIYREIYYDLGQTLSDTGRHKEAVKAYQSALANGPEATYVVIALARAYDKAGDKKSAKHEFLAALSYDPTNQSVLDSAKALGATQQEIETAVNPPVHQPLSAVQEPDGAEQTPEKGRGEKK